MIGEPSLPNLSDVVEYMAKEGWREGSPGVAGSLWSKNGSVIGVPNADDPDLVRGIIKRLAMSVGVNSDLLATTVRFYRMDVADFRAVADERIADTIPLETAEVLTGSARMMLRSAATTARRVQGDLRGHYSRWGDELAKSARMGHTKRGSFVIPIIVPLPDSVEQSESATVLVDIERTSPEPYERRAVRTLAQSLRAVEEVIIEPGREPSMEALHSAVELGVSRELCLAVSNVLAQSSIGELETNFTWGGSVRAPSTIPKSVRLVSEGQDLVEQAAVKLQHVRIEPTRNFSGDIIGLRHEIDDPYGYLAVSTIRNGRRAEIRIRLPYERYLEALQWHRELRPVTVEGDVQRESGRLVVQDPIKCHPLDELYLSAGADGSA